MNFNSVLQPARSPGRLIRSESKQEFFAVKKNTKRLKISNIFSDSGDPPEEFTGREQSPTRKKEQLLIDAKESKQQLTSTISSDRYLTFRTKQPKRKKNKNMHSNHDPAHEDESASDNQAPPSKSLQKRVLSPQRTNLLQNHPVKKEQISSAGFSISNFLMLGKIGQGTYSQVFKAIQRKTGFVCCLKLLNKEKMRALKVEENIFRQIKIHSYVNHPHITKLYGCFADHTYIYLICEFATDQNVYQHLSKLRAQGQRGLSVERVSLLVGQICSAVSYMHSLSIIHRDIKPENMIITYTDTIKLCDFGWSVFNPQKELRSTLCGTPLYLAPELIQEESYSEAVDVWAVGVLTYELLTGEIPFKIRSMKDLKKVVSTEIQYGKIGCGEAVDFIGHALKKDHNERYDIFQLYQHPFLKYYHQQTQP